MRLLLALALAALTSNDGISEFAGGQVKSPDGKWTVWASAVDADSEGLTTIARLRGPGVRDRGLMPFERYVEVRWPAVGTVVLIERTNHFASVHAFALARAEAGPDYIQRDIVRALAARRPRLSTVENRHIAFGGIGGAPCVLVEESGLPPGRDMGSFLARRAAFRLDYAAKRAVPVRSCPGARIE